MDWDTNFLNQYYGQANDLKEDIIKQYGKYNVNINLTLQECQSSRFIYKVKVKGNTREAHIRANAPDVQLKLKLPLLHVVKRNFNLYLIASRKKIEHDHLPAILNNPSYQECQKKMELPYIVGYNDFGEVVTGDLVQFPHLLLGGSSGSGKSVAVQVLISTIAYNKSPSEVNLILMDVGTTDLMPFGSLPHLLYPIVRDRTDAMHKLSTLVAEMERRINLGYSDPDSFVRLPKLVLVIDEFPALFMGMADKKMSGLLISSISSILQRGRHAKIHLVLAAQNPTIQNMKVDLGNITARIAFKCAKKNFSETILGEGGAENLMGKGDLLLRFPQYDGPQRVQGVFITPEKLGQVIQASKTLYHDATVEKFGPVLSNSKLQEMSTTLSSQLSCSIVEKWPSSADQLLAEVIVWALGQDYISTNMLMKDFHMGWNKAADLVKQLEELRIVEKPRGTQPRQVVYALPDDLPTGLITFLEENGYSWSTVDSVCRSRIDNRQVLQ